jgi:hypothetical protein
MGLGLAQDPGMARVGLKVLKACWAALAFILAATGVIG